MKIARTKRELSEAIKGLRANGKRIALVPTMGALHKGHISLIDIARKHADSIVASIFVNPLQFGKNEDFNIYPRQEKEDLEKLNGANTDIAYLPGVDEIYPEGFVTSVIVGKNTDILCGRFRPGHFDGVATVVAKLLIQALPDVAIFGEKDYQQIHIIKRLVTDLDIPVKVIGAPIIREKDGLAMSSRNAYLTPEQRKTAVEIYKMLEDFRSRLKDKETIQALIKWGTEYLLGKGFTEIDYIEVRDSETLELIEKIGNKPARILAAARLGKIRLIDNIEV